MMDSRPPFSKKISVISLLALSLRISCATGNEMQMAAVVYL